MLTNYQVMVFNDHFRNTIKSNHRKRRTNTKTNSINSIENVLTANIGFIGTEHFIAPQQAINYVECHDDATAFDYFAIKIPRLI